MGVNSLTYESPNEAGLTVFQSLDSFDQYFINKPWISSFYLNKATEREVLPEWVSLEAIVCQNPPQVRMVGKEHSIHVPYLEDEKEEYIMQKVISIKYKCSEKKYMGA